tara:strand:- start:4325 stop:4546 length:222 start_codon:yes stop_codon:yes gene_type:complete
MNKEDNEMLMLLKELVNKIKNLEDAVYHKDNLLMKSGLVVVDGPTPSVAAIQTTNVDDMEWSEIHKMVESYGG